MKEKPYGDAGLPAFLGIPSIYSAIGEEDQASEAGEGLPGGPSDLPVRAEDDETGRRRSELKQSAVRNMSKGRVNEAIKDIHELIALKPYEADYHLALGLCYRRQGKHKEAFAKYNAVLDLGGPKQIVYLLMAEVYALGNKKDEAFAALRKAAEDGLNIIEAVGRLRTLRSYRTDTDFIKQALHLEKFELTSEGFRDPFLPSQVWAPAKEIVKEDKEDRTGGRLTKQDQEELLKRAEATLKKIDLYLKLEDEDRAMQQFMILSDILKQKERITIPMIKSEFERFAVRREEIATQIDEARLRYYYKRAQRLLAQIKETFDDTDYPGVENLHNEVVQLVKEMQKASPNFNSVAERIEKASEYWFTRAKIRREFQAKSLGIQGVVTSEPGNLVIVNNRTLGVGDGVEGSEVVKIERNRVTFRYKGENIAMVFRRY